MRLLALDCATAACSAAVWVDGTVLSARLQPMARGQAEALMPMVAAVMAESGLAFADLDLLAVTVGPGAFTGIRIGLAAARGLALAADLPIAGITTTEAVARGVTAAACRGRRVLVALESKRDEIWVQAFGADRLPLGPMAALLPAAAARLVAGPVVLVGDAAPCLAPLMADALVSSAPGWPDAAMVAGLAAERWAAGQALPPLPLYLRDADVTLPP